MTIRTKNKDIFWLIGIILIVFIFNLIFLLKTEFFTGDSAYFNVRYVEHLLENKRPLTYDELSYGGRNVLVAPLFYYILAFFKLFLNSFFIYKNHSIIGKFIFTCCCLFNCQRNY